VKLLLYYLIHVKCPLEIGRSDVGLGKFEGFVKGTEARGMGKGRSVHCTGVFMLTWRK
jgi:hypothetical protein